MKLFTRFFLVILAFTLVPVVGLGLWMLSARHAVRDNARALHGRLALLTADLTERTLEQLNRDLAIVDELERAGGRAGLESAVLRRAAASDSAVAWIALTDAEGRPTAGMADPELFADAAPAPPAALLADVRAGGRVALGAPLAVRGETLLPAAHPLSGGRCLVVFYSLRDLGRRLRGLSRGGAGLLLLADPAGRPLPGVGDSPPDPDWVLPARDGSWDDRVPGRGGPWVAASSVVRALEWRAVSLQPRREAYAEESAGAARAAAFLIVLCVLVAGGAYLLSARLLSPIQALIAGAERVARGDFGRPVPRLGWGELDLLGATFNAMSEKVRRYQALQVERLFEEKARIEALVRNIPEGVLLAGFDGSVLYMNATAARILGARAAAPAARVEEVVRAPELLALLDAARAGPAQAKAASAEIGVAQAGGAAAIYACRVRPVQRDGRKVGILLLMRDVTLEREMERMKNDFLHALVHDLRGPVGVVDGVVRLMRRQGALDARAGRYADLADQALGTLNRLIADILDLAKLESGSMKLSPARTRASILLRSALSLCQVPAEAKGVAADLEEDGEGIELVCDGPLIERTLMNLAGNALKFTPSGGRIRLGARAEGAEVEFFVRDTGPGIPADKLDSIFEKFTQLQRDAAARTGYGLGLSICRRIVEVHGGNIWAESQEGRGSRFAFRIPAGGPPAAG